MGARRINEPIEPMTLGNMRANGVRSLNVSSQRHHRAIAVDHRRAFARPHWQEPPPPKA
jgi:hypothetical protein